MAVYLPVAFDKQASKMFLNALVAIVNYFAVVLLFLGRERVWYVFW